MMYNFHHLQPCGEKEAATSSIYHSNAQEQKPICLADKVGTWPTKDGIGFSKKG